MVTKTAWDGTKEDVETKKVESVGQVLLEVQDHNDGKFLVFGDPPPMSTDERIAALELRVAELEKKP